MKALYRFLLSAVLGTSLLAPAARAQTVPNASLDTWAIRSTAVSTGVEAPTGWQTTDDFVARLFGGPLPFGTNTVVKTTTARTGPFAAQLQTQNVPLLGITPGILLLGSFPNSPTGDLKGVPFTARPANLQFYYQLSGAQAVNDAASVAVQLTRRVNGTLVVVAEADYEFPALAANYTLLTLPLQYSSGLAPDSAAVLFLSGTANTLTVGTTLRVDDISFTGTVAATRNPALSAAFTAAPNPSPDGRYLLQGLAPAQLAAPLTVLDATGRVVRREPASAARPDRTLDLSPLPAGIYTVQLLTADGLLTRKLVR